MSPAPGEDDVAHMRAALALGRRHLGETWPNPSVGCVLVLNGRVVGRGSTAPGGRPHAETMALEQAGERASGADAFVTLEPCSHVGVTGPCTDALIAAGVARVVAGVVDPDPRVSGRGFARLREAGIAVQANILAAECAELAAGFFSRVLDQRPLLTLKLASTLDGRIATVSGESRWITGATARRLVHRLRAEHDAVLVGIGTALADDPDLTCRLAGARTRALVRVVLDRRLRLPVGGRLAATAHEVPVWLVHDPDADAQRAAALARMGVRLIAARSADMPGALGAAGLTRVLVEGGASVAASLLRDDLVDRLVWFSAPGVIGGDGMAAVGPLGVDRLADAKRFAPLHTGRAGHDMVATLARRR